MLWSIGLKHVIKRGSLTVIDAEGKPHHFGVKGQTPACTIRLHNKSLHYKLLLRPELYLGEAYMDGQLTMEQGHIYDLLFLFGINMCDQKMPKIQRIYERVMITIERLFARTHLAAARSNVKHHYDLSGALYEQFLDPDMQYSCAYFTSPDVSLEQAQYDKKRHLASKLLLKPGMRVLDIGCGWGGLALYLARHFDVHVTGLTLSEEQHKIACQRAQDEGLSDRVQFILRDYRQEKGAYDRIVSVGMFEHVGRNHYAEFFDKLKNLLTPDGVALLHSIARQDGPGLTNPWLKKYIFPGGYAPAMSEVLPAVERKKLWVTDIEILRMHYTYTIDHWYKRCQEQREKIVALYDERFWRMWEFYLCASEIDFRLLGTMVFQMQLSRNIDAVPFTRDYMFEQERALTAQQPDLYAAA